MMLAAGAEDGVRPGAVVVWGVPSRGAMLIGRVGQVYRRGCRALALGDPELKVPVLLLPSGAEALLRADADGLFLDYVDGHVRLGDEILTSGYLGRFPRGLLVGRVAAAERVRGGVRFRVRAAAPSHRLATVLVENSSCEPSSSLALERR